MPKVVMNDWTKGLNTIELVRCLRDDCGLGLKEAKVAVEGLISSNKTEINVWPSPAKMEEFIASLNELDVNYEPYDLN